MDDLISRKAAIDALMEFDKKLRKINWHQYPYIEHERRGVDKAIVKIANLPSAGPEPCGDVVSRNAIVQRLNEMDRYVSTELRLCDTDKKFPQNEVFIVDDVYEEIVEQLPSAQPERKKGKWVNCYTDGFGNMCKCSECGAMIDINEKYRNFFCYHCGARMERY